MLTLVVRRIGPALLTMALMVVLSFLAIYKIGNPIDILVDPAADQATREAAMRAIGYDLPWHQQFLAFLWSLASGNLGDSFVHNMPAAGLILQRFPATFELALTALLTAIVVGLPLGIWAGLRPESKSSKLVLGGSILGFSLPTFWLGLMLIMCFAVWLGWLPASGRGETAELLGIGWSWFTLDGWRHLLLPAIALGLYRVAMIIRLAHAGTREVARQDYIRNARAKGLRNARIVWVHILKNIMIPIITVLGMELGALISFATVTETVFAWPGMGKLLIESIQKLDRPVVVAYLLLVVFIFIFINLLVDLVYSLLDPRVRVAGEEG